MSDCPARLSAEALFEHPLAEAAVAVFGKRGFAAASVEEISERAGVGREEFDRLFADKEDAAARVFEACVEVYLHRAERAFASEPTWPDNLRAAAYETVRWYRQYPQVTAFGMITSLQAGERARLIRERVPRWAADRIDEGRALAADPAAVPAGAAMMAVGATIEMLSRELQGAPGADPIAVVPQLMYGAVRPYLGEPAARRELAIPPPPDLVAPPP